MPKRNFTPKNAVTRASQPAHSTITVPRQTDLRKAPASRHPLPLHNPLSLALEAERTRLEQAYAILGCLAHSLTYSPETDDRPGYAAGEVASAARALISQTLDRLEPVRLVQLMAASKLTYDGARKPC